MAKRRQPDQAAIDRRTKPAMREALVGAALQLFVERGFEQTTVDDIVALAGVGRRSFFRYFPSKEDVVFPDHQRALHELTEFLQQGTGEEEPVRHACHAARLVMRMYAEDPPFSVARFRLTRTVPALRTYELSVVRRYERVLADYLRGRYADRLGGALRAEVVAASVVAAHNHALRSWLAADGKGDHERLLDESLGLVLRTWSDEPYEVDAEADGSGGVVVMVARNGTPMWRVVQALQGTLGDSELSHS